jgi:hypothetical protein
MLWLCRSCRARAASESASRDWRSSSRSYLADREVSVRSPPIFVTGPVYDSGEDEKPYSSLLSETVWIVVFMLDLSFIAFINRNRDWAVNGLLRVALARDEADETEDEREVWDKSETIDSGEDMVEMELASEDRRAGQ